MATQDPASPQSRWPRRQARASVRALVGLGCCMALAFAMPLSAANVGATVATTPATKLPKQQRYMRGKVEAVDARIPAVLIDGLAYAFVVNAHVEIGGSYGAPTLLLPGMKVEFVALNQDGVRAIAIIRQLPDSTRLYTH